MIVVAFFPTDTHTQVHWISFFFLFFSETHQQMNVMLSMRFVRVRYRVLVDENEEHDRERERENERMSPECSHREY